MTVSHPLFSEILGNSGAGMGPWESHVLILTIIYFRESNQCPSLRFLNV